jgi:anti-sigma factor ChrR (cupin superfamily)
LAQRGVVIAELAVGIEIPVHAHRQREITMVLDGALSDDSARIYGPGDVLDMPTGSQHAISVVGDHDCLAVFSRRV